jgi:hypothetical protein
MIANGGHRRRAPGQTGVASVSRPFFTAYRISRIMNSAEKHDQSTKALGALARDALEEVNGSAEKATSRLIALLKNDNLLLQQVVEAAVTDAVSHRVQHNIRNNRAAIVRSIDSQRSALTVDRERGKDRVVAFAEAISSCLLDMPLAGGKRLRDVGRLEVMDQIDRYEKMAGSMTHKARWLRLIAQSLPDGKQVGNIITEKRALELFEEARQSPETRS